MSSEATNGTDTVIRADPSKEFFISMLTKDLRISDCVLDLTDNAIDKALETWSLDVMEILEKKRLSQKARGARIDIDFSSTEFVIRDSCGGMSIAEARNEVFLFGNPEEHGSRKGLSVYGIGMKRAFFKLGRTIRLRSWTDEEFFEVEIDVERWAKKDEWTFEFKEAGPRTEHRTRPGTEIRITDLNEGVSQRFRLRTFESDLRDSLSAVYALFLLSGVEIRLNERKIEPRLPSLATKTLTPARKFFRYGGVDVLLIAGVTPKEDRNAHGWYIFCNGRMVVEADKSSLTGWGEKPFPQFHSKYNHFLGFAYFGANVNLLPWRTTKQGVDNEAPVYQRALTEMRLQARPILNFLNDLYPEDQAAAEPERAAWEAAKPVSLESLPKTDSTFSVRKSKEAPSETVRIQYSRPRRTVEAIRKRINDPKISASKVGEYTFDYFVEQEIT